MEVTFAATQSLSSYAKLSKLPSSCSTSTRFSPSFFHPKASLFAHQSAQNLGFSVLRLQCVRIKPCPQRNLAVFCSSEGGNTPNVAQGWLLEPVGDGDWKHLGYKVEKPGAYEIFSSEMIVGGVPEKADLVIPVATVSRVHARIENKEGSLFVTDLDSTNGTYLNEKRVPPGATARVAPGSLLTFGDTHLAKFRVSKLEKVLKTETKAEPETESEEKAESEEAAAPQPETGS